MKKGNTFKVSVPNREVGQLIEEELENAIRIDRKLYTAFCGAVLDGNATRMEELLDKILLDDGRWKLKNGNSYALVLAAVLFGISGQYRVRTEQEGGNDTMDVLMEARRPGLCNMVFELKKVDSKKKLKPATKKALKQIREKRYYLGMEGTVLLYGISFWGKVPCMEHDRIELPRSVRRTPRTTPYIPLANVCFPRPVRMRPQEEEMDKDINENETINRKPLFPQGEDREMLESIDGQAIGIGKSQFRSLRDYDCYYVDKTALIDRVLKSRYDVFLFTRPRRFGKTLNLSMLDEYLGIQHADEPDIFEGLEIERLRPDDPEKNSNPVIRLSLKDMRSRDYPHFIRNMGQKMSALCKDYRSILDSDSLDKDDAELFRRIKANKASEDDLRYSLLSLTRMFHDAYSKPVILLIDEYDNILNETETDSLRTEILGFMSDFLSSVLKDNMYLRFAVLTGIAQIAQASIYSGLNSLYTDSVFDSGFGEYWGFTEDEVRMICRDFGDESRFEEAKEWYDGYRFGRIEAYNPWSVLNYVDRGFVPDTYWANNSRNTILNRMFLGMDDDNFLQIIELLSGGSFEAKLQTSLTYHEAHDDKNALYSLMAMTGYLRVEHIEGKTYRLSFPDKEVSDLMEWTACSIMVPQGTTWFRDFCTAVLEGRTDDMEDVLGKVLVQNSYWDLTDERSYKLVITTILTGIWRYYRVRTEQEGGNGRIDILMESRKPGRANIIMELKKADSEAGLEPEAKKALKQIREKRYYLGMEGTVLLYGISFWGKVPCMEHDRIELPLVRRCCSFYMSSRYSLPEE